MREQKNVCKDILNGVSITVACKNHDIDVAQFRKLIKADYTYYDVDALTELEFTAYLATPEEKLLMHIFEVSLAYVSVPDDFNEAVKLTFATLEEVEQKVLNLYYFDDMTENQISKELNLTEYDVEQIRAKALRKLRHPSRIQYFKDGVDNVLRKGEIADEQDFLHECRDEASHNLQGLEQRIDEEKSITLNKALSDFDLSTDLVLKLYNNQIGTLGELANTGLNEVGGMSLTIDEMDELSKFVKKFIGKRWDLYHIEIEDLNLSVRAYNCLKRAKYNNLGELSELTYVDFLKIRNLGNHTMNEILDKMEEYGVHIDRPESD